MMSVCLSLCRTIILVVVFSQFLRRVQVNFCVRIEGRWEERGFPFFGVFAVSRAPCPLLRRAGHVCRLFVI